ncbi:MAG TPA: helix-turn-helix domain-containing protein [Acidimicrobiia bacterium]|nr:helix-turn-helix domain-containing protein [Acidimicrobiia bacterium]
MVQDQELVGAARPTAAERLELTRTRLLDAVIESLAEVGFAATSTTEVARRSGLTRGAQLHHFGTKDQMLLAAVEHLNTRGNPEQILAALDQMSDDERLHAALAVLSRFAEGPYPAAYAELWLASRSHPELEGALREADVNARDSVRALFGPAILAKAGPEFDTLLDFTMYALRGMALDAHFSSREERDARRAIIVGLEKYLIQAMKQPRKKG